MGLIKTGGAEKNDKQRKALSADRLSLPLWWLACQLPKREACNYNKATHIILLTSLKSLYFTGQGCKPRTHTPYKPQHTEIDQRTEGLEETEKGGLI